MTSREQFERWFNERSNWKITPSMRRKGGYVGNPSAQSKWEVWQASREAIEVELPSIEDKKWHSSWHGRFREEAFWIDVKRRLVKLGLKVKQ